MLMDFEKSVANYIRRHVLIESGARVLVGVSGGADSVALLAVLSALGYDCVAAHCNFNLRGEESLRDRAHAVDVASRLAGEYYVTDFDTEAYRRGSGESVEMACRTLRYRWFEDLCREHHIDCIAVGHHCEDNVETALLNMLRGSGIAGVAGIAPRNGRVVRPLLGMTREQICDYLRQRGLTWVDDSSNASNDYKRNRLRNVVLPMIAHEFPPRAMDRLVATVANVRENYELYRRLVDDALSAFVTGNALDVNALCGRYDAANARMLLVEYLRPYGFDADVARNVLAAVGRGHTGLRFVGTQDYEAALDRGILVVDKALPADDERRYEVRLDADIVAPIAIRVERHAIGDFVRPKGRDASVLYLDAAVLQSDTPLTLRRWRSGDRIKPFGAGFTTLVSDIFSDAKLSREAKRRVWLLCQGDKVLWVIGYKASAHYPVTAATTEYLRLEALL